MRVFSRFALVMVVLAAAIPVVGDPFVADCPLTLVASNPASSNFNLSAHGIFRSSGLVYALRGQTLTTYTVTDLGDMQIARQDFIGTLASRDISGGVAFANNHLYVSGEAGIEAFNLTNVRAGGSPPPSPTRTAGVHYRRLVASGNILAGVYPVSDFPCAANGLTCYNAVDLYNISTPGSPVRVGTVSAFATLPLGFNDIALNFGYLVVTGPGGTAVYNISNPASPILVTNTTRAGSFLVSNGSNLVGVGDDTSVFIYIVSSTNGTLTPFRLEHLSPLLAIDRQNPVVFHPQGTFDEAGSRLIMMVDERDPHTLKPARTIAFDVFDFAVPQFEGSAPRGEETISYTSGDEVKWNPLAVGPYVYVNGEITGLQTWGACGVMAGKIELDSVTQLSCGGAEIHGWVSGTQKVANVELFLDNTSQGTTPVAGVPRTDVAGPHPVFGWRVTVNLDTTTAGEHLLRLVATDSLGNRRQIASKRMFFPGPGQNCVARRRSAGVRF